MNDERLNWIDTQGSPPSLEEIAAISESGKPMPPEFIYRGTAVVAFASITDRFFYQVRKIDEGFIVVRFVVTEEGGITNSTQIQVGSLYTNLEAARSAADADFEAQGQKPGS